MNAVNEIPIINSPALFGLHPNAEIMYYTNSAKDLWDNLLALQVQGSSSGSTGNKVIRYNTCKYNQIKFNNLKG